VAAWREFVVKFCRAAAWLMGGQGSGEQRTQALLIQLNINRPCRH
jgi:hypothetical protein